MLRSYFGHTFRKVKLEAMAIPEIGMDYLQRGDREEPEARDVKS